MLLSTRIYKSIYVWVFGFLVFTVIHCFQTEAFAQEKENGSQETAFVYDDHDRRDPFWPLVTDAGVIQNFDRELLITDLNLEGTMSGADGRDLAIINGRIVRMNDIIGKFTVTHIDKNSVVLSKDGKEFELKLKKED